MSAVCAFDLFLPVRQECSVFKEPISNYNTLPENQTLLCINDSYVIDLIPLKFCGYTVTEELPWNVKMTNSPFASVAT